jgi:nucleoside-diphosphate-sugar epimerase
MSTQTFLVIGATGNVSKHTVRHLLERGQGDRTRGVLCTLELSSNFGVGDEE